MEAMQSCGTLAATIRGTCPGYLATTAALRVLSTACTTMSRMEHFSTHALHTTYICRAHMDRRDTPTSRTIRTHTNHHRNLHQNSPSSRMSRYLLLDPRMWKCRNSYNPVILGDSSRQVRIDTFIKHTRRNLNQNGYG